MSDISYAIPYIPEIKLPDIVVSQTEKSKIGSTIEIQGTFTVKEKREDGIRIEIKNLFVLNSKRIV